MLGALDQHLDGVRQVVLAGRRDDPALRPFLQRLRESYEPNAVLALADPAAAETGRLLPILEGKSPVGDRPAVYVCERGACRPPVLSATDLRV